MRHIIFIILTFVMIGGIPGTSLSAARSDPWPQAVQANTDKMVEKGLARNEIAPVTQAMVQARFAEQEIIRLQNAVMQAYGQGLPNAPLNDKILEGIAKHAAPSSIILAVERLNTRNAHALRLAAELTEEKNQISQWGLLIATGNAAGLPFENFEKILQQVQTRSATENKKNSSILITSTLTTARDMARQTVPPDSVTKIIGIAIAKGFNGKEMQELNRTFATHARQNSLESVTRNCLTDLQRGTSPAEALHNFGSGNRNGGAGSKGLGSGGNGETGGTSGGNNESNGPGGNGGSGNDGGGSDGGGNGGGGNGGGSSGNGQGR